MINNLSTTVYLIDFYNEKIGYKVNCDEVGKCKYSKYKYTNDLLAQASGYAFEKNYLWSKDKDLYALFVQNERVFFLAGGDIIDVSSDSWRAYRDKTGLFKYKFILKEGTNTKYSVDYFEVGESKPGDFDPHFFVDVMHWLNGDEPRKHLQRYWGNYKNEAR